MKASIAVLAILTAGLSMASVVVVSRNAQPTRPLFSPAQFGMDPAIPASQGTTRPDFPPVKVAGGAPPPACPPACTPPPVCPPLCLTRQAPGKASMKAPKVRKNPAKG